MKKVNCLRNISHWVICDFLEIIKTCSIKKAYRLFKGSIRAWWYSYSNWSRRRKSIKIKRAYLKVLPNAIKYNHDAKINLNAAQERLKSDFSLVGKQLQEVGINVNCASVWDIQYEWADPII